MPKKLLIDICIAIVIFIASFYLSFSELTFYRKSGGPQISFYQQYFEPAVSLACGRGFAVHTPPIALGQPFQSYFIQKESPSTPLAQFLFLKRDSLDCKDLPPASNMNNKPPQRSSFYLFSTVGLLWKVTGISWSILDKLAAGLFSISMVLSYAIFRLGMKRILAIPLTILLCGSTIQLTYLPWLQDYAKAPFFLAIFYILGLILISSMKRYNLLVLAGTAGVIFGIGYGFRSDILIAIPPTIFTVLFFTPGGTFKNFPKKIAAIILMAMTFIIGSQPVLNNNVKSGSCLFDTTMEGLTPPFSSALNLKVSSIYEMGHQYNDLLTNAMIGAYADHFLHLDLDQNRDPSSFIYCSSSYTSAASTLYKSLIKFAPADLLIRGYAASNKILNLGFTSLQDTSYLPHQTIVLIPSNKIVTYLYKYSRPILEIFNQYGIILTLLAIFLIGVFYLRIAIFLLLAFSYFTFYPSIQFNPRHFFHLEFISFWVLGLLVNQGFRLKKIHHQLKSVPEKELIFICSRSMMLIISYCFLVWLLLTVARNIQTKNVQNLIKTYKNSEKQLLSKSITQAGDKLSLVTLEPWDKESTNKQYATGKMLMIEFGGEHCRDTSVEYTLVYDFDQKIPAYFNFSKSDISPIFPMEQYTLVFTPVYKSKYYHFSGIQLKTNNLHCLGNVYEITNLDNNPLWLFLKLPYNWHEQTPYQTINETTKK